MHLRWILVLTLLLSAPGCDRTPGSGAAVPWFDAFADGAFLPRDPWLDFVELYRALASEGGGDGDGWRVPYARWLEIEDGWGGSEEWGVWGVGRRTRFRFLLRYLEPYDLFVQAIGPPGAEERPQSVTVVVNGEDAGSFAAGPEWQEHRIRLSEDLLKRGWNQLQPVPASLPRTS